MRLLFLTHAFNSLSQRLFVELTARGHEVSLEFDINDSVSQEAVTLFRPDLILAPFLKRAIPEAIWRHHLCLVVHPGIVGDRGPSALDWAILNGETQWGLTLLQANGEMDAGEVWASEAFPLRDATKASLYRHEVTAAAVRAVLGAVERFEQGERQGIPPGDWPGAKGCWRPLMTQADRAIDWQRDDTETILRKIRSGDGFPGVRDRLLGRDLFLYDAHADPHRRGEPGALIARAGSALCRATRDGAVWLGHLRDPAHRHPFKLPAARLLGEAIQGLPEVENTTYPTICYEERDRIGYLHFPFYNGAMGVGECRRLLAAYREARQRPTRLLVLLGGPDFWSNGMHLNLIEVENDPAQASWENINAMDDLAEAILTTDDRFTLAALQGNAGAGGVFLARAADRVWARPGVVINPHYKDMGNLYGSEFWTYLLPRHAGPAEAQRITQARLPMGMTEAQSLGLVDAVLPDPFLPSLHEAARRWIEGEDHDAALETKRRRRTEEEARKPLAHYRAEELERMRLNFFGFDPSYHVARYHFVHKTPKSRTPLTLASHRRSKGRPE